MTTESFLVLYRNERLKTHINQEARRHSSCVDLQCEYVQEAWLRVCAEPTGQRDLDWYREEADRAIQTAYQRERRYTRAMDDYRAHPDHYYADRYA